MSIKMNLTKNTINILDDISQELELNKSKFIQELFTNNEFVLKRKGDFETSKLSNSFNPNASQILTFSNQLNQLYNYKTDIDFNVNEADFDMCHEKLIQLTNDKKALIDSQFITILIRIIKLKLKEFDQNYSSNLTEKVISNTNNDFFDLFKTVLKNELKSKSKKTRLNVSISHDAETNYLNFRKENGKAKELKLKYYNMIDFINEFKSQYNNNVLHGSGLDRMLSKITDIENMKYLFELDSDCRETIFYQDEYILLEKINHSNLTEILLVPDARLEHKKEEIMKDLLELNDSIIEIHNLLNDKINDEYFKQIMIKLTNQIYKFVKTLI